MPLQIESIDDIPYNIFLNNQSIRKIIDDYYPLIVGYSLDKFIRATIARWLRINGVDSNKIKYLLIMGINSPLDISIIDSDIQSIAAILEKENKGVSLQELGVIVIGQIMTKLPRDISEFISTKLRIEIFLVFIQALVITKEAFDTLHIDRTFYNILSPPHQNINEQKKIILPQDMGHIIYKVEADLTNEEAPPTMPKDYATYIDGNPTLMVGPSDNDDIKYFYYDKTSNTLSELPSNNDNIQIDASKLEELLKKKNIDLNELGQYIDLLAANSKQTNPSNPPASPTIIEDDDNTSNSTLDIIYPIVGIIFLAMLIVGIILLVIYYSRTK